MLEKTQRGDMDITSWLMWYLGCLKEAILASEELLSNVLLKAKFWNRHVNTPFNDRQRLMINKLLNGFDGKLRTGKWAVITKTSEKTAQRDIEDLVEKAVLSKGDAGGRSTSYELVGV